MSSPTTRSLVAIFNSRAEFIDALREALDREGLPTATALLAEIQDGTLDLVAFLEAHDPKVIVYDLPRPFEKHRSEEHTSELQSPCNLVCRLLLEKKKKQHTTPQHEVSQITRV